MSVLKTSLRNFLAHKGRMILSGLAVVISVAFVCGTLVFTATMQTTFDKLFADTASDVMVTSAESGGPLDSPDMTGRPASMPSSAVDAIAGVGGVTDAHGVVESESVNAVDTDRESIGPTTGAPTLAMNWSPIELRTSEVAEGGAPDGPDQVMVDSDTAESADLSVGDTLLVETIGGQREMTISGISVFTVTNPGAALLYFDTATAQELLLDGVDGYTTVYVDGESGVTDEELKDRVIAAIGDTDFTVMTNEEYVEANQDAIGEVFDVIRYVLLGFAGIALLVGIFLIINTFTMLVAQRTREIGLFRAIGASRKQINRSVLIEALLLGLVGSVIGFGAGVGIAVLLMQAMSAVGMNLSTDDLTISASVPITGVLIGVLVTLIAAYIPARRAGKITPMAALQDPGMPGDVRAGRIRAVIGGVLTTLGAASLLATTMTDDAVAGSQFLSLGILFTLVGLVLFAPALVGAVVKGLSVVLLRAFGPIGRLAERNALRNPRRTGATASALMIGLALVSALAVVGSSMVSSATKEIDESIGADFIIQTSNWMPIMPDAEAAVAGSDHLDVVASLRLVEAEAAVGDDDFQVSLSAMDAGATELITIATEEGDVEEVLRTPGTVAIDAGIADKHDLSLGDSLRFTMMESATADLTVRAILELPGDGQGGSMAYVSTETVEDVLPPEDMPLVFNMMALAEEGQQDAARAALEEATADFSTLEIRDQAEYKKLIEDEIGMLLNMVYGLLALAIIVAVLGVVNTLALSVVERTREIGLMRSIGLSRRQLRRMIRLESVVIALFGAVLGVVMGLAWGIAAQQLLALQGLEVLAIPWGTVITVFLGAAIVGLLAALLPAYRAGRMNVLDAIATE